MEVISKQSKDIWQLSNWKYIRTKNEIFTIVSLIENMQYHWGICTDGIVRVVSHIKSHVTFNIFISYVGFHINVIEQEDLI